MRRIPVKRLLTGYLPPEDARWIIPPAFEVKTVVGLCEALNMLADIVAHVRETGGNCALASAGTLSLTDTLSMEISTADADMLSRQKKVYDALYRGEDPGYDETYRVSKDRNCSSIITRFHYADRSVLLTGDSYGGYWEDRPEARCDILKLPHHGDEKSMTPTLLHKLAPAYAVISCNNNAEASKERPAVAVMEVLLQDVPSVLCTENRVMPGYPAGTHERVRFCIYENGEIDCEMVD